VAGEAYHDPIVLEHDRRWSLTGFTAGRGTSRAARRQPASQRTGVPDERVTTAPHAVEIPNASGLPAVRSNEVRRIVHGTASWHTTPSVVRPASVGRRQADRIRNTDPGALVASP